MQKSGFREVAHTADWEIEVWAVDLPGLLSQCAQGMYALSGIQPAPRGRLAKRTLNLQAPDAEGLLVRFLNELLHFAERERRGFTVLTMTIRRPAGEDDYLLVARLAGRKIIAQTKEIKAVTYHNLQIRDTAEGLAVNVVFDV